MSPTMKALGIDKLSASERIELALEIWESLEDERPVEPLSDEQYAEILRRDAEMDVNPGIVMTWAEARAKIEGKRTAES